MSLKSTDFFLKGTHEQFEWVLGQYQVCREHVYSRHMTKLVLYFQDALRAKAEAKNSKPENLLKLDKWFHNDLPKKIKARGKVSKHVYICVHSVHTLHTTGFVSRRLT